MLEKVLRLAEWHERLRDQAGPSGPSYRMHRQSASAIRALVEVAKAANDHLNEDRASTEQALSEAIEKLVALNDGLEV